MRQCDRDPLPYCPVNGPKHRPGGAHEDRACQWLERTADELLHEATERPLCSFLRGTHYSAITLFASTLIFFDLAIHNEAV